MLRAGLPNPPNGSESIWKDALKPAQLFLSRKEGSRDETLCLFRGPRKGLFVAYNILLK